VEAAAKTVPPAAVGLKYYRRGVDRGMPTCNRLDPELADAEALPTINSRIDSAA
jgi:hypothetical protein